jgi:hypothetical protein
MRAIVALLLVPSGLAAAQAVVPAGVPVPARVVVPGLGQPAAPPASRPPPVRLGAPAGREAASIASAPLAAPPSAALAVGAAALAVGAAAIASGGGSSGPATTVPRSSR